MQVTVKYPYKIQNRVTTALLFQPKIYPRVHFRNLNFAKAAQPMSLEFIPAVQGPDTVDIGFVSDFLERTNHHESERFFDGDKVDLKLTYPGYHVDPVLLKKKPGPLLEGHSTYEYPTFGVTICLRPLTNSTTASPPDHTMEVKGLLDENYKPAVLFSKSNEPISPFVAVDSVNGNITVQATSIDEYAIDLKLEKGIYVGDSVLDDSDCLDSKFMRDVWKKYECQQVKEGVLFQDGIVPSTLASQLRQHITALAKDIPVDWHPGSSDCVRDLVHPSLFPYARNESPVTQSGKEIVAKIEENAKSLLPRAVDRWGRKFELSKYQWLPTVFHVDDNGKVTINGYINNLDQDKHGQLYTGLGELFEIFLPRFEKVHAYANAIKILPDEEDGETDDICDIAMEYNPDEDEAKLRNMDLRVITKIVDYELQNASDFIDGVFHVEGMSSDHIMLTGIYILDRDDDFEGGKLEFRRTFLDYEGSDIFMGITQSRHWMSERIVEEMIRPLGELETPKDRLIVFPNSHIHKLSKMSRKMKAHHTAAAARRRVIVFWVVDPKQNVVTTCDVPKQQGGTMTLDKAKEHRLSLMEERKRHKGRLNGLRKVSLCEH